ncbi:MBL fold metallo-hydrolase [Pseudoteredinibacter isoporae]|uniref:Glyoxylase-like metal-dependent hydrolase (Beta-lactamase superfamily II) n=1 Tax=Pseudoteredinibacter isoporae TaxID=570281 RepID=A0A7X0JVV5_9GAMM|nr:MBL fold metallo-hydrolase [Pseudoteredinibacter isoporae]MBB6522231.1 glyoxylase-like metal-dependent hydrolase (beta-lactamase superfamily II) [Pseudoteredinibacter isoporae]NHO87765.1 MBL fold metallo-hydrolase [Pseudoteredinibacter isoporae]NIB23904.1 MBL fold metallo-hydrolase [Pseudoteredinibacter isoporae]
MKRLIRPLLYTLVVLFALLFIGVYKYSPYLLMELHAASHTPPPIDPDMTEEEYWTIEKLSESVYAIGELSWYQKNWHYLIIGEDSAVLFDVGTGRFPIRSTVEKLTDKPIIALPSHLHYDHVGNLKEFEDVRMIDIPSVRKLANENTLHLDRYSHLGFIDQLSREPINIHKWIMDLGKIDLGDRELSIVSIPGHTDDSIALYDPKNNYLFTGDTIHRGTIIALLPGSSRSGYIRSMKRLTILYGARQPTLLGGHAAAEDGKRVPAMDWEVVGLLQSKIKSAEHDKTEYQGDLPRVLNISEGIEFHTGFDWSNQ